MPWIDQCKAVIQGYLGGLVKAYFKYKMAKCSWKNTGEVLVKFIIQVFLLDAYWTPYSIIIKDATNYVGALYERDICI